MLVSLVLGGLLGLAAPPATTWVVDASGGHGAHFTAIQPAVDAAASGDVILIYAGVYREQLVIDGKAVTLQGMGAAFVAPLAPMITADPVLTVRNLAAGQEVHLRDVILTRITGVSGPTLSLHANAGRVWVEEVFIDTYDGGAIDIDGCADVMLSQVYAQANAAGRDALGRPVAAPGVRITGGSRVQAFELTAIGSHGPPLFFTPTQPIAGGDAMQVVDAVVHLSAAELRGGGGGSLLIGSCVHGAIGGSGLWVRASGGAQPAITVRGSRIEAALSGRFDAGCASDPGNAVAIDDPTLAVTQWPGTPRLLQIPTIPYPNGNFEIEVRGAPNDLYAVLFALHTLAPTPLPGFEDSLLIDPRASLVVFQGQLDARARAVHTGGFANQSGAAVVLHGQALHVDATGAAWLSSPGSITF